MVSEQFFSLSMQKKKADFNKFSYGSPKNSYLAVPKTPTSEKIYSHFSLFHIRVVLIYIGKVYSNIYKRIDLIYVRLCWLHTKKTVKALYKINVVGKWNFFLLAKIEHFDWFDLIYMGKMKRKKSWWLIGLVYVVITIFFIFINAS